MTTLGEVHKCPICQNPFGSRETLEAHVPDCSVSDALDKVAKQDIPGAQKLALLADLGQIARAFAFAHEFDDATDDERSTMYVCTECYKSAQDNLSRSHCGACGRSGTMMLASTFVDSLIEGEDAPKHLLN